MKAAQVSEYGDADKIALVDVDKSVVAAGQVLIEVYAGSVNPWDSIVRSGAAASYMPLEFPFTVGGDLGGVVTEVGEGVVGLRPGDKVYGSAGVPGGSGAFAEFAVAGEGSLAVMPAEVDFEVAAAAALTGVSAIQAIIDNIKLQPGQKILIHGGAGGIGSIAIQIAKNIGAHVTTTATGNGMEFAKELGADKVIDYKTEDFALGDKDFDAVFDTVGGETFDKSFSVVKPGGVIVSMSAAPSEEQLNSGVRSMQQMTNTDTITLNKLSKLIEDGVVKINIDKVFTLDQVVEAFKARESGQIRGKVVVRVKA